MAIWNLKTISAALAEGGETIERETENQAGWVWEEIMGWSSNEEKNLSAEEEKKIRIAIDRILTGEPVQYIAGHAWFYGLKMKVTPAVLIPRPETEELVEWILSDLKNSNRNPVRILEIGTGSGCISIALKKHLGVKTKIVATDLSSSALEIAKENATNNQVEVEFVKHDFLNEALNGYGKFDIIVSNPPYISFHSAGEVITKHLQYEPSLALYPEGDDPDIFYKRMAFDAGQSMASGGACYMELNEFRADGIRIYFQENGWRPVEIRNDLQGAKRMLKAGRPL